LIDYEDGTPASTPQMAYDVSNFLAYMQRRTGYKKPDFNVRQWMLMSGFILWWPFKYLKTKALYRNLLCMRYEMYAVRDGVYYHHLKKGMKNSRADQLRGKIYARSY